MAMLNNQMLLLSTNDKLGFTARLRKIAKFSLRQCLDHLGFVDLDGR